MKRFILFLLTFVLLGFSIHLLCTEEYVGDIVDGVISIVDDPHSSTYRDYTFQWKDFNGHSHFTTLNKPNDFLYRNPVGLQLSKNDRYYKVPLSNILIGIIGVIFSLFLVIILIGCIICCSDHDSDWRSSSYEKITHSYSSCANCGLSRFCHLENSTCGSEMPQSIKTFFGY